MLVHKLENNERVDLVTVVRNLTGVGAEETDILGSDLSLNGWIRKVAHETAGACTFTPCH